MSTTPPVQTTPWILHRTSITGGVYHGLLTGPEDAGDAPALTLTMGGATLAGMEATPVDGGWQVQATMGVAPLTDGTQTMIVRLPDGTPLDSVTVITGLDAPEDLRAEVSALRDELAVLKSAFRRHASEAK